MRVTRSEFHGEKLRHILCETGNSHCKRKNCEKCTRGEMRFVRVVARELLLSLGIVYMCAWA
jgi:hypothetical protein